MSLQASNLSSLAARHNQNSNNMEGVPAAGGVAAATGAGGGNDPLQGLITSQALKVRLPEKNKNQILTLYQKAFMNKYICDYIYAKAMEGNNRDLPQVNSGPKVSQC